MTCDVLTVIHAHEFYLHNYTLALKECDVL